MEYFCKYLSIGSWKRQPSHGDKNSSEDGFLTSTGLRSYLTLAGRDAVMAARWRALRSRFDLRPDERKDDKGSLLNWLRLRRKLLLESFAA